jgi:hypothetical protein
VRLRHERHGLDPCQRGPLALVEERRLAPRIESVQPLLGFAGRASIKRVHVDAESAAVDL